ncbi:MAG: hypothetical protein ACFBZ8_02645 [Opitutales bacterium]
MKPFARIQTACVVIGSVILFAGCGEGDPEVTRYDTPKYVDKSQPATAAPPADRSMTQPPPGMQFEAPPELEWVVPPQFNTGPEVSGRIGSFVAIGPDSTQAEIAVTGFPAGMPLPLNIQRWRRQIGLPENADSGPGAEVMQGVVDGERAVTVIIKNPENSKTTSVTIVRFDGFDYFFKISGDSPAVATQTPAFARFVDSVRFPKQEQDADAASIY